VAGMTDPDAARPNPYARGCDFTFFVRQQLRIAHAGKVFFTRHNRSNSDRAGPRTPADLVDPDHDAVACCPAFPLDSQRRIRSGHVG
jgi:hypothetical protein